MNFVADESVDAPIVAALRREGHHIAYVAEISPSITDDEVLTQANQSGSILITMDKDFGELVYRLKRIHAGVVLLRLAGQSESSKTQIVVDAIRAHAAEFANSFTVITSGTTRIRKPSPP